MLIACQALILDMCGLADPPLACLHRFRGLHVLIPELARNILSLYYKTIILSVHWVRYNMKSTELHLEEVASVNGRYLNARQMHANIHKADINASVQ